MALCRKEIDFVPGEALNHDIEYSGRCINDMYTNSGLKYCISENPIKYMACEMTYVEFETAFLRSCVFRLLI
jgi:hypothetical protein